MAKNKTQNHQADADDAAVDELVTEKSAFDPKSFWTPEKREAMRATMKAKYADEGLREKLSESMKEYWSSHDHPMKGKTFTEAQKENMRAGQRRYRQSLARE